VYSFLDDQHDNAAGTSSGLPRGLYDEREELPNGIITTLTKCYVSTCGENDQPCYAWSCPRRVKPSAGGGRIPPEGLTERTEADEVSVINCTLFRVQNGFFVRHSADGPMAWILLSSVHCPKARLPGKGRTYLHTKIIDRSNTYYPSIWVV
jgi:hypothetical protein